MFKDLEDLELTELALENAKCIPSWVFSGWLVQPFNCRCIHHAKKKKQLMVCTYRRTTEHSRLSSWVLGSFHFPGLVWRMFTGNRQEPPNKTFGQGSSGKETRVMILLDSGGRWDLRDLREEDPMLCKLFVSSQKTCCWFLPTCLPHLPGEGL